MQSLILITGSLLSVFLWAIPSLAESSRYFGIQVVDQATGRGVPLVELETIHQIRWVTDSLGWGAIDEPDLMNRRVFFMVRSHGYEFPRDGFGYRGKTLHVEPGGTATLEITRRNLAERLYRITGSGIYRDSVLLNKTPLIQHPLEGTYTHSFSGNPTATPHYDYNQIMYRLDLAHAALNLPVPFYTRSSESSDGGDSPPLVTRQTDQVPAFYALEHPDEGTISMAWDGQSLRGGSEKNALFYALPATMPTPPPTALPLSEFTHTESGRRVYSTARNGKGNDYRRSEEPVCLVWTSGS